VTNAAIVYIAGTALSLRGPDIDTDRIMPARFLRAVTFEGLEAHLFADDRVAAAREGLVHPFDDPARAGARVLVVESNFGCGSSREHAPQALRRRGLEVIIGESFADIFASNALGIGLACAVARRDDLAALHAAIADAPARRVTVDLAAGLAEWDGGSIAIGLPAAAQNALLTGEWDSVARLVEDPAAIDRVAARLPYLDGFA
jgi:3-isopropylmalate/(R)-2-methylmalate dehydratase small subunit